MTDIDPRFLKELGRLAQRYPPEQWSLLADLVDDKQARRKMRSVLREMTEASRAGPPRRTSNRGTPPRAKTLQETIERIAREDPDRAAILDALWAKLRARELMPTMAAVKSFVEAAGLGDLKSSRRDQAVTEVMEYLAELPRQELETVALTPAAHGRHLGEEYDRWVRLILDRKPDEIAQ
jgi:hypothetical protein